ncbi:uncharacterized protein LOC134206972 [Armigeres subalbatus]|uniref:uncharacterized protein LOC134206972 n=1 Tax=Armigeres subalbatus TaxID=124917 RepID=UPI002ED4D4BA
MLMSGRVQVPNCGAIFQETQFGWVLSGSIPEEQPAALRSFCARAEEDIEGLVKRFWEIETYCDPVLRNQTNEEECLNHFQDTHERTSEGRYVVQLPFNELKHQLGNSRKMAEKRFLALERRLDRAPALKEQYMAFLREYELLGHMELSDDVNDESQLEGYYLPHHYVLKPSSTTTRLRVVFDGSAESSTGVSINHTQLTGPTVQNDLISIVSNFRVYKYGITADIPKMYRQVEVHSNDRRYQKILNRFSNDQPLQTYVLRTVTYGLASSPFLATMTLRQLAIDEGQQFPLAAIAVEKSFYIDDVLTGAHTLEEALELKDQIIRLLQKGGFSVHKICSNSENVLQDIPREMQESSIDIDDPTINTVIKTLGVAWCPREDCFTFVVPIEETVQTDRLTKRMILSQIAKIFDPLGFVGPVVTAAKLIMRELWSLNLDWDQPVPSEMANFWTDFRNQLHWLNELTIPRWILANEIRTIELHGFADASDLAYGACLYSRLVRSDGTAELKLICSKSRILPKKKGSQKEITTPRAELLAAQLLSRLTVKQLKALDVKFETIILWSDSQIVLCWLTKSPDALAVYVGNRVREIQELTEPFFWKYIPSKFNPADCLSRGVEPKKLKSHELWWNGPHILSQIEGHFTEPIPILEEQLPELRKTTLIATSNIPRLNLFNRISRYSIIQRTMAYVVRFCDYIKSGRKSLTKGLLTTAEVSRATTLIIRLVQKETFNKEICALQTDKEFKFSTRNLNPFIDEGDGIMRVGCRLKNAIIPYQQKHPALLPKKYPMTVALVRYLHRSNMHIGQRGLLAIVRQQYWPLDAKSMIRNLIHQCIPCFRAKPTRASQLMGNLPDYRVQPFPVFANTGLDFAGPFQIRSNAKLRSAPTLKGYVCVFVCMATRALHLEAVSDLTTDGFMGALQRFVSRRGLVHKLYSDNATNFEGAKNEMRRLASLFKEEQHQKKLNEFCTERTIEWSFIPPRSPHMGGIWEAGVKSVKSHLKMVMAENKLSFEQLATVLAQIEAILNSRPLSPLSNDPNDIAAITPAHFLIGREFQAIPEPSYQHLPQGRLSKWQLVQDIRQRFWRVWTQDYLHELQQLQRDFKVTKFEVGALVLIVDDNSPPLQWQLARIIELHQGNDGHTRVVTLRTKNGTTKRAIKKICVLPLVSEPDH